MNGFRFATVRSRYRMEAFSSIRRVAREFLRRTVSSLSNDAVEMFLSYRPKDAKGERRPSNSYIVLKYR